MSYPYRVVVTRSIETIVGASDRATHRLNLTPILPAERMREILEEVLEKKGWHQRDDGAWEKAGPAGERMVCDPAAMEVTAAIEAAEQIKKERTVHATGDAWSRAEIDAAREKLREAVEEQLEKELKITGAEQRARERDLQAELAERLAAGEADRRRELNEIVMEVYAESLKEKARSLGQITEIHESRDESGSAYELTIRIAE